MTSSVNNLTFDKIYSSTPNDGSNSLSYKEQLAQLEKESQELHASVDPVMKKLWDLDTKKRSIQRQLELACDGFYPRDELEFRRALTFFHSFAKDAKGCISLEGGKPSGDKKFEFKVTSNFSISDWGTPELQVRLEIITRKRTRVLGILEDMIKSRRSWEGYWTFTPYGCPLELNSSLSQKEFETAIEQLKY